MGETKMRKTSAKRTRFQTIYQTQIANAQGTLLAVRRAKSPSDHVFPPYLEFELTGKLGPSRWGPKPWCRWTHSLRRCGDDLVALLAQLFGYDTGDYVYSGAESVRGVVKAGCVILYFGDGEFTFALYTPDALELLRALASLFEWDLTEEESE